MKNYYNYITGKTSTHLLGVTMRRIIESQLKIDKISRCGNDKFLGIFEKAFDGNYYTLPTGKEGGDIYQNFLVLMDDKIIKSINTHPTLIKDISFIKRVECEYHHSICIDINDNLWLFEYNEYGELGL